MCTGGALYALLRGLDRYLGRAQLSLADVFRLERSTVDAEAAIRSAYASLPRQPGGWVALADLRSELGTFTRGALDDALVRMNRHAGVSLVPGENHKTLTVADSAAAVTVGGRPYHFLLIEET
jgi:hypothetical protein